MKYLSSKEISMIWKMTDRSVRNYCANGRILGCYLEGKKWLIPADAKKPIRSKRTYKGSKTLLRSLIDEKNAKLKGRIYHKLQIEFTYNSNHIEGNKLTHDQTRFIFDTQTLGEIGSGTIIDDVIETTNHFKCIDYVIDNAKKKLTESTIKQLHLLLKQSTFNKYNFKIGDYKNLPNEVGETKTTEPSKVKEKIKELINKYNSIEKVSIKDIIDFHYQFERIHPFQDGNGRVGRLVMLKECLKHNIVPILIRDDFKEFYYCGLKEYKNQKGYLIDTCLHGQDIVKSYLDYFKIKY